MNRKKRMPSSSKTMNNCARSKEIWTRLQRIQLTCILCELLHETIDIQFCAINSLSKAWWKLQMFLNIIWTLQWGKLCSRLKNMLMYQPKGCQIIFVLFTSSLKLTIIWQNSNILYCILLNISFFFLRKNKHFTSIVFYRKNSKAWKHCLYFNFKCSQCSYLRFMRWQMQFSYRASVCSAAAVTCLALLSPWSFPAPAL